MSITVLNYGAEIWTWRRGIQTDSSTRKSDGVLEEKTNS
jgi:hypothetical protein